MTRPIILIPSATHPDCGEQVFANLSYVRAIEEAGGVIFLTGRPKEEDVLDTLILMADGLLLMGGSDMAPREYGENDCAHIKYPDPARDALELGLLARAEKKGIPIFGVCRGLQVMNVSATGSLLCDLKENNFDEVNHERNHKSERSFMAHDIAVSPSSLLARIIGGGTHQVNSLHHQGIKSIGEGLTPTALAPDGLIEAIEKPAHPFWLGVQWHPEELEDAKWKKLFHGFILACEKERAHRASQ